MAFATGGSATFNNRGAYTKSRSGASTFNNPVTFNNSGTVNANGGPLSFAGGYTQTGGATIINGGSLTSSTTINIQGGILSGMGTITANVSNDGQVSPGLSPGTLTINGNYTTQSSTGALNIEISGLAPSTEFDRLVMTGQAVFGGTVNIASIDGIEPNLGASFQIVTFGSRPASTEFATANGLDFGNNKRFDPTYTTTSLTLTVVSSP